MNVFKKFFDLFKTNVKTYTFEDISDTNEEYEVISETQPLEKPKEKKKPTKRRPKAKPNPTIDESMMMKPPRKNSKKKTPKTD